MAHAFLFVDDSALHHQMYRLIFSRGALAGNTLYHATNGREGYALLTQHPELALVFLDLNMPEMNGLEVLARRAAVGGVIEGVPRERAAGEDQPVHLVVQRGIVDEQKGMRHVTSPEPRVRSGRLA